MKRRIAITLIILCTIAVAGGVVYLLGTITTPENSSDIPHYLVYNGEPSKIYFIDAVNSYGSANETYATPDGQIVEKGTPLFLITMTLRNDYTADNPAPPLHNQVQTSPADGTAYLYLIAQLFGKDGKLNSTNVSVSDFSLPAVPGTGVVLSSGQTGTVNIYLVTSQTNLSKFEVNLYFLGDSIPSKNT
jgi:hypothetical protein